MKRWVRARFGPDVLGAAARRYGASPEALTELLASENFVYEFPSSAGPRILRLTPEVHRDEVAVRAELAWITYLADHGMSVCRPIDSPRGAPIEVVQVREHRYLAVAFEKAPGERLAPIDCGPALLRHWGRVLGRMHRLTEAYRPADPGLRRHHWHEEDQLDVGRYVPAQETHVLASARRLLARLRALPTEPGAYGLVHANLHLNNFLVAGGRITAFDFDDACRHWFAYDLAVPLYHFLRRLPAGAEPRAHAGQFVEHVLDGYREEHQLTDGWVQTIPDFLRLRHVLMYVVQHQSLDVEHLAPAARAALDAHRDEVAREGLFVDLEVVPL